MKAHGILMSRGPWALELYSFVELLNNHMNPIMWPDCVTLPSAWTHINLVIAWAYISFLFFEVFFLLLYFTFFSLYDWRTRTNWPETRIVITESRREPNLNKIRSIFAHLFCLISLQDSSFLLFFVFVFFFNYRKVFFYLFFFFFFFFFTYSKVSIYLLNEAKQQQAEALCFSLVDCNFLVW